MSDAKTVLVFAGAASNFELLDDQRQSVLPVAELRRNLAAFMDSLKDMLPADAEAAAGMRLEEVTVTVGIDGKGKVGFLGVGAEVGGNAALALTFKRASGP